MITDLAKAVRDQRVLLFVGAGVSNDLGLPVFSALIDHLADSLGYDPDIFHSLGDYLTLCEYYMLEHGDSIGPLLRWMDRSWHRDVSIGNSEVHRLIVELNFPVIYTTNYDSWLEKAHQHYGKPFTKIANVGQLADADPSATQIIKFHGDFDDDQSIVLTESQYFDRLDFESPLDIRLRADLLHRSVLFIGYSLSDINVRYMLYRLNSLYNSSGLEQSMPQSYIYLTRPNSVEERVLKSRGIEPIVTDSDNPSERLKQLLRSLLALQGAD